MRNLLSTKSLVVLFLTSLLLNCKSENNADNKPANFIERETFVNLIYDVNLLEGNLGNFNLNQDVLRDSAMTMYKGIFEKYKIDYTTFKENQDYYILTDQYKEVSQEVLERVKLEEEKYKDIKPIKIISFTQLSQLLDSDGLLTYFEEDTASTYRERLDSALSFYRSHSSHLSKVSLDSLSFEVNITKLKKGRDLFQEKSMFKKMPTNE